MELELELELDLDLDLIVGGGADVFREFMKKLRPSMATAPAIGRFGVPEPSVAPSDRGAAARCPSK